MFTIRRFSPKITEKFFAMKARHVMISSSQSKSKLLLRAKNRDYYISRS
jgi:hypothetical protein